MRFSMTRVEPLPLSSAHDVFSRRTQTRASPSTHEARRAQRRVRQTANGGIIILSSRGVKSRSFSRDIRELINTDGKQLQIIYFSNPLKRRRHLLRLKAIPVSASSVCASFCLSVSMSLSRRPSSHSQTDSTQCLCVCEDVQSAGCITIRAVSLRAKAFRSQRRLPHSRVNRVRSDAATFARRVTSVVSGPRKGSFLEGLHGYFVFYMVALTIDRFSSNEASRPSVARSPSRRARSQRRKGEGATLTLPARVAAMMLANRDRH